MWHGAAQHSTAQCSTAQHSTAQHSTAQHSTAQQLGFPCVRTCHNPEVFRTFHNPQVKTSKVLDEDKKITSCSAVEVQVMHYTAERRCITVKPA